MSSVDDRTERHLETLRQILREFSGEIAAENSEDWTTIPDVSTRLPHPFMVWWAITLGTDCQYVWQPIEKTLWSIRCSFRDIPMRIEHGKFGIRLAVLNTESTTSTVDDLVATLRRSFPVVDSVLQPMVEQQIQAGNVTLQGRFFVFDSKYKFFRDHARRTFVQDGPSMEGAEPGQSIDIFKPDREGYFFASAAIDAFFSRLEYVLVAIVPFCGYDRVAEDLIGHIGSNWATKFKRVFDVGSDRRAEPLYRELRRIKEQFRNSEAHGGFEKDGLSFLAHMPQGAIPARLSKSSEGIGYSIFPVDDSKFDEICATLDSVDELFALRHPLAWTFVKSGLSIRFDEKGLKEYQNAMTSAEAFEEMMDRHAHFEAQATNMDW